MQLRMAAAAASTRSDDPDHPVGTSGEGGSGAGDGDGDEEAMSAEDGQGRSGQRLAEAERRASQAASRIVRSRTCLSLHTSRLAWFGCCDAIALW